MWTAFPKRIRKSQNRMRPETNIAGGVFRTARVRFIDWGCAFFPDCFMPALIAAFSMQYPFFRKVK